MPVTEIETTAQFDALVGTKQLVAEFTSGWCKPCGWIGPKYEQLSRRYGNLTFVVVDGDKLRDLVARYKITGLPQFIMFRGGRIVDEFGGIVEDVLERRVARFAGGVECFAVLYGGMTGVSGGIGSGMSGILADA